MKITMSIEGDILKNSRIVAVVGLSGNPDRPSYRVASYLKENGYTIIPVNPSERMILEARCYPSLKSIHGQVEIVDIFRKSEDVLPIVIDSIEIGANTIWMQEGVINEEAANRAKEAGLKVVMDKCMLKEHQKLAE
ncbi:CoA-binding protein [Chloroflexota bacterium]